MSEPVATPGTAQVSDLRRAPRGVVPRGFQTWLMVGLAVGIVLIILLTGQREPPKPTVATSAASAAPNPDRLRDYQERLRAMEARQALEAQAGQPRPRLQSTLDTANRQPRRQRIPSPRIGSGASTRVCSRATSCRADVRRLSAPTRTPSVPPARRRERRPMRPWTRLLRRFSAQPAERHP